MSANKSPVLLISGFDDHGTGGLFCFDGSRLEAVDRVSTTGLSAKGTTIGRLLRSSSDSESSLTELLVYDAWGVVEYRRLDGILDPHDLVRLDDASWLIVSSANNSLTKITSDGDVGEIWRPTQVLDSWHPNCAVIVDGEIWITAFGRFSTVRGWASESAEGAGFLLNLSTGEEFGGLTHPHSPRRIDGDWWVCNSLDGTLRQWDALSSHWESRLQLSGYPRGMAKVEGTLYVGESQTRGQFGERARLAIIEEDRVVERIPVPCAEIYDVVLASSESVEGLKRGFNTNQQRVAAREPIGAIQAVGPDAHLPPTATELLKPG